MYALTTRRQLLFSRLLHFFFLPLRPTGQRGYHYLPSSYVCSRKVHAIGERRASFHGTPCFETESSTDEEKRFASILLWVAQTGRRLSSGHVSAVREHAVSAVKIRVCWQFVGKEWPARISFFNGAVNRKRCPRISSGPPASFFSCFWPYDMSRIFPRQNPSRGSYDSMWYVDVYDDSTELVIRNWETTNPHKSRCTFRALSWQPEPAEWTLPDDQFIAR